MSELDIKHLFEMVLALSRRLRNNMNSLQQAEIAAIEVNIQEYLNQFKEGE